MMPASASTTPSEAARSPSRLRRAMRVGRVAGSELCPLCGALAVATPPPGDRAGDWMRCQAVGCGRVFRRDGDSQA